jgi:hypothetical protein
MAEVSRNCSWASIQKASANLAVKIKGEANATSFVNPLFICAYVEGGRFLLFLRSQTTSLPGQRCAPNTPPVTVHSDACSTE